MERIAYRDNAFSRTDRRGFDTRYVFEWPRRLQQRKVICFVGRNDAQLDRSFPG